MTEELNKDVYRAVFGTDEGKRVLDELLQFCHMFEPPAMDSDVVTLSIKNGRRDVGHFLYERLGINPADVIKLIGEP